MFEVVIIGAGISGLQAALSAKQAGLSFVLVEARDRVGGKVWTVPLATGRGQADLGAAWINDELQPRITAYTRQFGLKTVNQTTHGTAVMQLNSRERFEFPFGITPDFSKEDKKNFEGIRDHFQIKTTTEPEPLPADDVVTLDEYCRKLGANETARKMINVWSKVMHGVESNDQPATFFTEYCRKVGGILAVRADDKSGGNYQRFVDGAMNIAHGLAKLIGPENIQLSEPVNSIHDQGTQVKVVTRNGKSYIGRRCIISLPSPLLKDVNIQPALPAPVREISNGTRFGHYNKAIVCYNTPWWREKGYNGFFMSFEGPAVVARDTSVDEKKCYAITCFVNGEAGGAWGEMRPHERRAAILKQMANVFQVDSDSECWRPIEFFDQVWKHEEYSKGAFLPITDYGHLTRYGDIYGKPVGNLHFVGTEYAQKWKGYMEGALETGERGVKEVLEAKSRETQPRL